MALVSIGKLTATPGTPIALSATKNTNANVVYIQYPFTGNTGPQVYIGASGLVKATLVGVFRILVRQALATTPFDRWDPQSNVNMGPFDLSAIFFDADAADFILVSYLAA
jgi:hypothetical protein